MVKMLKNETFSLLSQEGHLISSCLGTGLTELTKARFDNKGAFYTALFNLSVGFERLMKAIVIIEFMLANKMRTPTKKALKSYGHDILELYATCVHFSQGTETRVDAFESLDIVNQAILQLLNEFAVKSRYHNLDSLGASSDNVDPLVAWDQILVNIVESDASKKSVAKYRSEANAVAVALDDATHVDMTGLKSEPLNLESVLSLSALHGLATRIAVLRVIKIITPLKDLLSHMSQTAFYHSGSMSPAVPLMGEFLDWLWYDRKYILRKKKWP
jgi:hypothetical protein